MDHTPAGNTIGTREIQQTSQLDALLAIVGTRAWLTTEPGLRHG